MPCLTAKKICDELNEKQEHPEWIYNLDGTLSAEENSDTGR